MPAWRNIHELYRAAWKCPTRVEDGALIIKVPYATESGDIKKLSKTRAAARRRWHGGGRVKIPLDKEAVLAYLRDHTYEEAGKKFGVSSRTIINRLKEWK